MSAAGKKELWKRWRTGESISDIARALRKAPGSIHGMIEVTGGISPPDRRRRGCAPVNVIVCENMAGRARRSGVS